MKKNRDILPEHVPGGENLNSEVLEPANRKYRHLARNAFLWLLCGVLAETQLFFLFRLIGGVIGSILSALLAIFTPVWLFLCISLPISDIKDEFRKIGFDGAVYSDVLRNRSNDQRAWGEPVTRTVYYRIRCRKCRKISPWKDFTLTSCTEETLADKIADFKKKTLKKRRDFISRTGFAKYSLDRVCHECGAKQPKHPPRWYSIPIITAVGFIVSMILFEAILGQTILKGVISDTDAVTVPLFLICTFLCVIFAVRRYILGRKNTPIQFAFSGEEKSVPFPEKKSTEFLWFTVLFLNAASYLMVFVGVCDAIYDLFNYDHPNVNKVLIVVLCAVILILGAAGLVFLFRKKKIFLLFSVLEYAGFVPLAFIDPVYFGHYKGIIIMALFILLPALLAVPFVYFKRKENWPLSAPRGG